MNDQLPLKKKKKFNTSKFYNLKLYKFIIIDYSNMTKSKLN